MVKKLVPGIETKRVAVGGATLETLWNNDEAKLACADDQHVVVLQEDLPETTQASFRRHAKLLCDQHAACCKYGAEPVFYAAGPTTACRRLMTTRSAPSTRKPLRRITHGSRPPVRRALRDQAAISSTTTASHPSLAGTSPSRRVSSRRRSTGPGR